MSAGSWGGCPNEPPCGHFWHDVYELGDPYPTCCETGCRCGHPGDVEVREDAGVVTVVRADPVIRVSNELLDVMADDGSDRWDPDGMVLVLDTAGEHRYGYLRPDPADPRVSIFGRVKT